MEKLEKTCTCAAELLMQNRHVNCRTKADTVKAMAGQHLEALERVNSLEQAQHQAIEVLDLGGRLRRHSPLARVDRSRQRFCAVRSAKPSLSTAEW